MPQDLSLYIHFPFCQKKCGYCDFYSETYRQELAENWVQAVIQEIGLYQNFGRESEIRTIYLGGGSPNLLNAVQFRQLFEKIKTFFNLTNLSEFTVESNPVIHDRLLLEAWREFGVSRVNIGVQSFHANELGTLERIHPVDKISAVIQNLQEMGFLHIGLDLIYGIPGQTMKSWSDSLERAIGLGCEHLSLYNLSYEDNTHLSRLLHKGKLQPIAAELERQMYLYACDLLAKNGFQHYEISNWAKPGCESRHNQAYWDGASYLGLGPAAHSFDGASRWWNVRSIFEYINILRKGNLPVLEKEILSEQDQEIEHLFLRLRTASGLQKSEFENLFLFDFTRIIDGLKNSRISEEYWIFDGRRFKLTPEGWFVSDSIIYKMLNLIEEIKSDHKKG